MFRLFLFMIVFTSCAVVPSKSGYLGPKARPASVVDYYQYDNSAPYWNVRSETIAEHRHFTHRKFRIDTAYGEIVVQYFQRKNASEHLIIVFPILGGNFFIESYFARFLANHGFDSVIIHRDKNFKKPELFFELEQVFRKNVIRDRIAMDFFEREYGKKNFGSFGLSRGAMNATVTAGAEPRLRANVLALGGSHLVQILKKSDVRGIRKYRKRVIETNKITNEQFFEYLEKNVVSDPKNLAPYLNANNTLMFLSVFDQAVPIKYGMRLRRQIGYPRTIFLLAGHYTALLYTKFVFSLIGMERMSIVPIDIVEAEMLKFFNDRFETKRHDIRNLPLFLYELPFELVGRLYFAIFK
jgi:hypothetical protein